MAEPADKGESTQKEQRESKQTAPKGRPTPSRKAAQAANARPLVPGKMDKDAQRQAKLAEREAREKARVGAMMGDEKYLPARDQGPQRKLVRDFVDSRLNFGEWMIPLMVVVLLLTLIPNDGLQLIFLSAIWGYVALSVIDAWLCGRKAYKLVAERFGADRVQSGTKMYAAMRSLQMRMLRMPKAQVKRGHKLQ
ncbi:DUF3043 domain-containing protein [Leucobacter chinensis]|uniref:DUF3043 domain-containing protein n=1 Tax=Leucobacter chinensis TaxID=2851010 RepID=UPI001C214A01